MRQNARFAVAAFLLLAAGLLPAATRADFDGVVDFSVSLKTVAAAAAGGPALPAGKLFVLDGTVSEVAVLDREPESFRARIELLAGEWLGTEDVKSYACIIEFSGPAFARSFPSRPPQVAAPDMVLLGSRILVVVRPAGVTTTRQGERRMVMEGLYIRAIQ
jgi:hypothetical protein